MWRYPPVRRSTTRRDDEVEKPADDAARSGVTKLSSLQRALGNRRMARLLESERGLNVAAWQRFGRSPQTAQELSGLLDDGTSRRADPHSAGREEHPRRPTDRGGVPPIVHEALRSPGRPLDADTRSSLEPRLGIDLGAVRVHTDGTAAESAGAVDASAYTVGRNVVFGQNQFDPFSPGGQALLVHELTHVAQQSRSPYTIPSRLPLAPRQDPAEGEAERAASMFAGDGPIPWTHSEAQVARADSSGGTRTPTPAPAPAPAATPTPAPAPKPPAVDPATAKARAGARTVLTFIKTEAKKRAKAARSVSTSSKFYKRLTDFYLKDYLKKPSKTAGKKAATDKIGKTFAGPATPGDAWEKGALDFWNKQKIPDFARRLRPALPAELAAGTDILSRPNRAKLPFIDVPYLVGTANMGTGFDADVAGGGKNISQLMHWATGVKYSDIDKKTMRELFLAYELWHLEAWDVFGEDPINDLIAEEAGRILGTQLRAGTITKANLQSQLNAGFEEARAWVGSLLRVRQAELDKWILAEKQEKANIWWGAQAPMDIWGSETIFTKLKAGETVGAVKKSTLVDRIINIYTLIFEAGEWEAKHGKIDNGDFIKMMQSGKLNTVFKKMAKGDPITSMDVLNPGP